MLSNVNSSILLLLLIAGLVAVVTVIVVGVILAIVKKGNSKKVTICTLVSIIIAGFSWILNFGWLRFFMTFLLIPVIHGTVFFLSNIKFAKYTDQSTKMKKMNFLFIITYLMSYFLMPDGGDTGEMYFFFSLIHNDILAGIASFVSSIAITAHILLFVLQIVEIRKIKKTQ